MYFSTNDVCDLSETRSSQGQAFKGPASPYKLTESSGPTSGGFEKTQNPVLYFAEKLLK